MSGVLPTDYALDYLERLVEEAAEQLDQHALAGHLAAMGETPPAGLLPTYHKLRKTLLSGTNITLPGIELPEPKFEQSSDVTPIFDKAFFLFGLRRSGNHALIEWLKGHFRPEETLFLNSADLAPFEYGSTHYSIDFGKYADLYREVGQKVLIVSYENLDPALFPQQRNSRIATTSRTLLLLRDLPNMAASIAKSARKAPSFTYRYRLRDFPDLWCRYARYYLSEAHGWETISFNSWVENTNYRTNLQHRLGLPLIEVSSEHVSSIGGGSSFDGTSCDGSAQSMDVQRRWIEMQDDPLFQFLLLAEKDGLDLNKKLFHMDFPGCSYWLERWQNG